jgi:hypothetical protein
LKLSKISNSNSYSNNSGYSKPKTDRQMQFKANIYLCNFHEFDCLKQNFKPHEVGFKWIVEETAYKIPQALTERACDCIVNVITNKTGLLNMSHIQPTVRNMSKISEIKEKIFNFAIDLSNEGKGNIDLCKKKMGGLITGGKYPVKFVNSGEDEGVHRRSPILLKETIDTFKKIDKTSGMDYSIIALNKAEYGHVDVLSDAKTDTHYLYIGDDDNRPIFTTKKLFENLYIIKISPNDKVLNKHGDITEEIRNFPSQKTVISLFLNRSYT